MGTYRWENHTDIAKMGEVWASKAAKDIEAGKRQRLRVISTTVHDIHFRNEDTGSETFVSVKTLKSRFRLMEAADDAWVAHHLRGNTLALMLEDARIVEDTYDGGVYIEFDQLADFIAKYVEMGVVPWLADPTL